MLPAQNYTAWKACVSILHVVAISSTIFRLFYRHRTLRLWWDDYAAIVPLVMDCSYFIVLWLRVYEKDPGLFGLKGKIVLHHISTINFITIIWWTRISLGLAIARILPRWEPVRKFAMGMICIFGLIYVASISWAVTLCVKDKSWHRPGIPIISCGSKQLGMMGVSTDVISDCLLVAIPLFKLRRLKLFKNQRRLVLSVFSSSFCTLLATIVYATFTFGSFNTGPSRAILMIMTAHIEASVSLIVCNLLVVVAFFYRTYRGAQDIEATDKRSGEGAPKKTSIGRSSRTLPPTFVLTDISTQYTVVTSKEDQVSCVKDVHGLNSDASPQKISDEESKATI